MCQQQTLEQSNSGDANVIKVPKDSQISSLSQLGGAESTVGSKPSSGTQEPRSGEINMQSMFSPNNLAADLGIGNASNQSRDTLGSGLVTLGQEFSQRGQELSAVGADFAALGKDLNTLQSDINALLSSFGNAANPGAGSDTAGGSTAGAGSDTTGTATNAGSDTTGSTSTGGDTTGSATAGSDTVTPPPAPANTSDGGIVTGNFGSSSGGVTGLPQNADLQTLADTMTTNALSSGEFNTPGHGTPITFAPGDVTPVSGTSVTVVGHTFSLSPTNGYPSGDLTEDGSPVQFGGWSAAIRVVNGQLWVEDAKTMGWRTFDGNGGWSSFQGDPGLG